MKDKIQFSTKFGYPLWKFITEKEQGIYNIDELKDYFHVPPYSKSSPFIKDGLLPAINEIDRKANVKIACETVVDTLKQGHPISDVKLLWDLSPQ